MWNKLVPKGYILYDSTSITFLKSQNYLKKKKDVDCLSGFKEGFRAEEDLATKRINIWNPSNKGNVLYLDYQCQCLGCDNSS